MEECTFIPDTTISKRPGEPLNQQPRELYGFLSDQQRYLEVKNLKIMRGQQDKVDEDLSEFTGKP